MIIAINYADKKFEKAQRLNTKTAYSKGKVDRVIEYSPSDIDDDFIKLNKNIFNYSRGAGLWLWKPYFVLKTLREISYGDYLFYCDSGVYYMNKVQYLIDCMESNKQEIMSFGLPLISKQWTKRETFVFLECDSMKYKNDNQVLATYFLVKKTDNTIKFFEEFLKCCCDEKIISYKIFDESIVNDKEFISHREDQSIFSVLCQKNNLKMFRDPSQFGDRPWEYRQSGFIYKPRIFNNSKYPQIVCSYRKENIRKFKFKEFIKKRLFKLGIYNEAIFERRRKL